MHIRVGDLMTLKLQVEIVAKEMMIPFHRLPCARYISFHDLLRDLTP